MISRRTVLEVTQIGRCRTYFSLLCPHIAICATPQPYQCTLRHFSKKRTRLRSQYRRQGNYRTDWEPLNERTLPATAKPVEPRTVGEAFGWKPIAFMLIAPIVAWGTTYAFVAPDVREKMLSDTGLVMFKKEATETVALSDERNECGTSEDGVEDHDADFKK